MTTTHDKVVSSITTSFGAETCALEVLKKAAYRLSDRASFDFRRSKDEILCRLDFPTPLKPREAEALMAEFRKEVLDQDLRRIIAEETAPVRNAILAHAFSRTGLQDD